ncbi:MAG: hypothetical protein ACRAVC_07490 [Trichormus sp.]
MVWLKCVTHESSSHTLSRAWGMGDKGAGEQGAGETRERINLEF